MITILHKERLSLGPWCIACINQCGQQERSICDVCQGYVATYWRCPRCFRIDHFYAYDEPKVCSCGFVLPSMTDLKFKQEARVLYQVAEELYD